MATLSGVENFMAVNNDVRMPNGLNQYGHGDSNTVRSPLHMNLGFFKNLSEKRTTKDGQTPKRRGPKPDSKPALTRRQELNRQAQRTHRERKEIYIKQLEEEVLRLKETFTDVIQEKNMAVAENRRLKDLLRIHKIPIIGLDHYTNSLGKGSSSYGGSSLASRSGSYAPNQGLSPVTTVGSAFTPPPLPDSMRIKPELIGLAQSTTPLQQGLDYDQLGIEFVLALEATCVEHQHYMAVRGQHGPATEISGHVLNATCPPRAHIMNTPEIPYPHQTWDIPNQDLVRLLDLSQNLPLRVDDGELAPIQALKMIRSHERFMELTMSDFAMLRDDLKGKSRCYGFGAVLEEFEVRDALASVLATKGNFI